MKKNNSKRGPNNETQNRIKKVKSESSYSSENSSTSSLGTLTRKMDEQSMTPSAKPNHQCICCDSKFDDINDLFRHHTTMHSDFAFAWSKALGHVQDIPDHNAAHLIKKSDTSQTSQEKATTTAAIKQKTSGKVAFDCEWCKKDFASRQGLQNHILTVHFKKRVFECKQCSKKFSANGSLKRHVDTVHKRKRAFECRTCLKSFALKHHLKNHLKTVHPTEHSISQRRDSRALSSQLDSITPSSFGNMIETTRTASPIKHSNSAPDHVAKQGHNVPVSPIGISSFRSQQNGPFYTGKAAKPVNHHLSNFSQSHNNLSNSDLMKSLIQAQNISSSSSEKEAGGDEQKSFSHVQNATPDSLAKLANTQPQNDAAIPSQRAANLNSLPPHLANIFQTQSNSLFDGVFGQRGRKSSLDQLLFFAGATGDGLNDTSAVVPFSSPKGSGGISHAKPMGGGSDKFFPSNNHNRDITSHIDGAHGFPDKVQNNHNRMTASRAGFPEKSIPTHGPSQMSAPGAGGVDGMREKLIPTNSHSRMAVSRVDGLG